MTARSMFINTPPLLPPATTTMTSSTNLFSQGLTAEEHQFLADKHLDDAGKNTKDQSKYRMHMKRYHAHKASYHTLTAETLNLEMLDAGEVF